MRTIRAYIKNFPSVAGWFALQGAAKIAIQCLLSFSEKEEEGKKEKKKREEGSPRAPPRLD